MSHDDASEISLDITHPDSPAASYLSRLEALAEILVRTGFDGTDGLWRFQKDLLKLQRDIQAAVSTAKAALRRDREQYKALQELRLVRWNARKLGDAFAWSVLDLDRKVIRSLSENAEVPVSQEGHGTHGMLAIAAHLGGEGWGFPLIHDVTHILRIGDVTFVKMGEERSLRTVEVKTRLVGEKPATANDKQRFSYEVSVITTTSPQAMSDLARLGAGTVKEQESPAPKGQINATQTRRQMRRISNAVALREAADGQIVEIDGKRTISTAIQTAAPSYWQELRKVITDAEENGYASMCIERTCLYVALYSDTEISPDQVKTCPLPDDVQCSGMLEPGGAKGQSAVLNYIPSLEGKGSQLFLPFYLYSIPWKSIVDLIYGRLLIVVIVNPARIIAALESDGFEVHLPLGFCDLSDKSIILRTTIDVDGKRYPYEIHGICQHITEAIYEFRGIEWVLEVARSMRESTRLTIIERLRLDASTQ